MSAGNANEARSLRRNCAAPLPGQPDVSYIGGLAAPCRLAVRLIILHSLSPRYRQRTHAVPSTTRAFPPPGAAAARLRPSPSSFAGRARAGGRRMVARLLDPRSVHAHHAVWTRSAQIARPINSFHGHCPSALSLIVSTTQTTCARHCRGVLARVLATCCFQPAIPRPWHRPLEADAERRDAVLRSAFILRGRRRSETVRVFERERADGVCPRLTTAGGCDLPANTTRPACERRPQRCGRPSTLPGADPPARPAPPPGAAPPLRFVPSYSSPRGTRLGAPSDSAEVSRWRPVRLRAARSVAMGALSTTECRTPIV